MIQTHLTTYTTSQPVNMEGPPEPFGEMTDSMSMIHEASQGTKIVLPVPKIMSSINKKEEEAAKLIPQEFAAHPILRNKHVMYGVTRVLMMYGEDAVPSVPYMIECCELMITRMRGHQTRCNERKRK